MARSYPRLFELFGVARKVERDSSGVLKAFSLVNGDWVPGGNVSEIFFSGRPLESVPEISDTNDSAKHPA